MIYIFDYGYIGYGYKYTAFASLEDTVNPWVICRSNHKHSVF